MAKRKPEWKLAIRKKADGHHWVNTNELARCFRELTVMDPEAGRLLAEAIEADTLIYVPKSPNKDIEREEQLVFELYDNCRSEADDPKAVKNGHLILPSERAIEILVKRLKDDHGLTLSKSTVRRRLTNARKKRTD